MLKGRRTVAPARISSAAHFVGGGGRHPALFSLASRTPRLLAGCGSAIALIALLAGNASMALSRGARASADRSCTASGLDMWVNPTGAGTAGSFYFHLELVNVSGHTCTLDGYPGVSAVNLSGHQIGSPAARELAFAPHVVTLAPDYETMAVIHVTDVGVLPPTSCRPATAAGFRVYPPGQRTSRIAPYVFETCSKTGTVSIRVRAINTEPAFYDLYL